MDKTLIFCLLQKMKNVKNHSNRVYLKICECRGRITFQRALRGLHTITGFRDIDL